jgi:hypothetical protein
MLPLPHFGQSIFLIVGGVQNIVDFDGKIGSKELMLIWLMSREFQE